ncbi:response regulator transcription factor [Vibrio rhodolitus]|uniref:response regulator transcription factor n=1 Tax=Vibrio rhodolitus TaxID=2231649 RepID=UPI000E0A4B3B|nr:response regulator transcription factor [Vibrio rhodolitus]
MNLVNKSILIIEDNIELAQTIVDYFDVEGIMSDHAANGVLGLELLQKNDYDAVILDVNLPLMSGFKICQILREEGNDIPILMLSGRVDLSDKLCGFKVGTDDYLTKPFSIEELAARVTSLLSRRIGMVKKRKIRNLEFDLSNRSVVIDGMQVKVSPVEYKILKTLVFSSPAPVSREKIIESVWGDMFPDSNSLKVHMHNLRKTMKQSGGHNLLQTVSKYGYVLK